MPAQCLVKNVIHVVTIPLPLGRRSAGLKRNGPVLPDIANTRPRHLLRILIQHLRVSCFHVAKTIEPPSRVVLGAVSQSLWLVKVHQQSGMRKSLEPDVNQRYLGSEGRRIVAATPDPVAHG